MGNRRTRKQKEKAKHKFLYLEPKEASDKATVKGQIISTKSHGKYLNTKVQKAAFTDRVDDLASIKKNIGKSVILASLILSLELMIYLVWR